MMIKHVVKSNGQVVPFEPERLNRWGEWADRLGVLWSEVVLEATKRCHDGCTTRELHQAMIDVCIDKQSQNYSDMAGRLLLGLIYKEAFGGFTKIPTLQDFYKGMVSKGLWEEMDYSEAELLVLANFIEHSKDLGYGYAVLKQFRDKYGIKDVRTDKLYESPQFMFLGMAMKAFEKQPKERRLEDIKKLYTYLSDLKINAPTPYLNGLRARKTGYASCCLIKANDTANSIGVATHIAYEMTTKQAGIGMFMNLRSIGDGIRNNTIEHMGKLGYYRMVKDAVQANKQKSRGGSANVFYTMLDPQIEDLLRLKHPTTATAKRINEIDYGVIMGDAFLDAVIQGKKWPLISVKDAPELYDLYIKGSAEEFINAVIESGVVPKEWKDARELMLLYTINRVATGRVYPAFSGNMNRHTPFKELLPMSNLCMEVVLPVYGFEDMVSLHSYKENHNPEVDGEVALCFLASLVAGRISKEEYEDVAYYALAMVDSVMDEMDYPYLSMKRTVQARRSVGIGITNVAHYMAKNYVTYSSRAGKTLLHELAEMHSYYLHKASLRLSKERGLAEWIGKTKYVDGWVPPHTANKMIDSQHDAKLQFDWEELSRQIKENGGIRNSVLEAYMPNESSSLATNTTNGIYPIRDFILTKKSATGNVLFIVPDYEELKYMYEIAWNTPTRDLIDCYAIFQKFTGQAISADFYINYAKLVGNKVSAKEFMMDTLYAWRMGMKTQYYVNSMVGVGSSSLQEAYCEGCGV
jgi:ribonucleoside-diphosphate reductase alpha chain